MNWKIIAKSLTHSEMRNRILAVLGMLFLFRILAHIPVPLSDPTTLKQVLENLFTQTQGSQLLGFLNTLSGGALANFSIVLVGLGPYINASIIMQILTKALPRLEALNKEGEYGRKKINQITRMLTLPLAIVQSIGTIYLIRQTASQLGGLGDITANTSMAQWVLMVAALTGGAMLMMWMGELITERSIGNGISLLITVGIVSTLPSLVSQIGGGVIWTTSAGESDKLVLFGKSFSQKGMILASSLALVSVFVTWAVVKLNEASRRLTVNYAKRVQGNRTYGGVTTVLPVKLITAGVIPIIFALAFLSIPAFAGQLLTGDLPPGAEPTTSSQRLGVSLTNLFQNPTAATFAAGGWQPWIYPLVYFLLVFVFTYFYTGVTFNSKEIAENLHKQGGFLAGIRAGKDTEKYLSTVVNRLTLFGALALGLLAVMPIIGQIFIDNQNIAVGGTSILILVAVALETLRQVESRALMITYDQYEQPDYFYDEDGPEPSSKKSLPSRLLPGRLVPRRKPKK